MAGKSKTDGIPMVSDVKFDEAYDEMCRRLEEETGFNGRSGRIEFHFIRFSRDETKVNTMCVNWAAIGTSTPEETAEFARALTVAANLADEFPYNGYRIRYED